MCSVLSVHSCGRGVIMDIAGIVLVAVVGFVILLMLTLCFSCLASGSGSDATNNPDMISGTLQSIHDQQVSHHNRSGGECCQYHLIVPNVATFSLSSAKTRPQSTAAVILRQPRLPDHGPGLATPPLLRRQHPHPATLGTPASTASSATPASASTTGSLQPSL